MRKSQTFHDMDDQGPRAGSTGQRTFRSPRVKNAAGGFQIAAPGGWVLQSSAVRRPLTAGSGKYRRLHALRTRASPKRQADRLLQPGWRAAAAGRLAADGRRCDGQRCRGVMAMTRAWRVARWTLRKPSTSGRGVPGALPSPILAARPLSGGGGGPTGGARGSA